MLFGTTVLELLYAAGDSEIGNVSCVSVLGNFRYADYFVASMWNVYSTNTDVNISFRGNKFRGECGKEKPKWVDSKPRVKLFRKHIIQWETNSSNLSRTNRTDDTVFLNLIKVQKWWRDSSFPAVFQNNLRLWFYLSGRVLRRASFLSLVNNSPDKTIEIVKTENNAFSTLWPTFPTE